MAGAALELSTGICAAADLPSASGRQRRLQKCAHQWCLEIIDYASAQRGTKDLNHWPVLTDKRADAEHRVYKSSAE